MVLGLGQLGDAIDERDRLREAVEDELPLQRPVGLVPAHEPEYGARPYDSTLMQVARKQKTGYEVLCEAVFRPLAQLVALALAPLRVPPPAVVLANAACALAGAVLLARGQYVGAALLLQLKTVLDNADGQLARMTGRVTAFGRYLDSLCDLATNAAIFAGLGWATGRPWLALTSFAVLTLVLSVNFNLERIARGTVAMPPDGGGALGRVYGVVYAPQDRLLERLFPVARGRRAIGFVANFGLSTQIAALGVCLALGRPELYLVVPLACAASLLPLALRRRAGTAAVPEAL
jgi:phosphatidylglycerophosphate synthase